MKAHCKETLLALITVRQWVLCTDTCGFWIHHWNDLTSSTPQANVADHHLHPGYCPLSQPAGSPRTGVPCRFSGISLSRAQGLFVRPAEQHQQSHFMCQRQHWESWERGSSIGGLRLSGWNLVFLTLRVVVAVKRTKDSEWRQLLHKKITLNSVILCFICSSYQWQVSINTPDKMKLKLKDKAQQLYCSL